MYRKFNFWVNRKVVLYTKLNTAMVRNIILVAKNTHGSKSCVIYKTYPGMVGDIIAGAHLGSKSCVTHNTYTGNGW